MTAISRPPHGHTSAAVDQPGSRNGPADAGGSREHHQMIHTMWQFRVPGPQTPGLVSSTTAFAGLLLTLTPFLWTSGAGGVWTSAGWNEVIVGIILTILGLTRLVHPLPLFVATGLGCLLGGWLVLAPLILDYGLDPESTPATIVDILIGCAVLMITILGHTDARTRFAAGIRTHNNGGGR